MGHNGTGHGTWDVPGSLKNLWDTSHANTDRSLSVVEKGEDMINFMRPEIIWAFCNRKGEIAKKFFLS